MVGAGVSLRSYEDFIFNSSTVPNTSAVRPLAMIRVTLQACLAGHTCEEVEPLVEKDAQTAAVTISESLDILI